MAKNDGTKEYQVARGRSVVIGRAEHAHPAKVTLPALEGDQLVADGFLTNPRTQQELADKGVAIGLEGKNTVGPAVIKGKDLPGPDDE